MQKLIFFDTETTGNMEDDVLCQLAYKSGDKSFNSLYNPGKKIPAEASAVHHITNKMVEEKPKFKESEEYEEIKNLFEDENTVVVAHNAVFDLAMMEKEGIMPFNYICTLKVVRALDVNAKFSQYKLQYLRYALDIEIEATAHDALGDVMVLEKLFDRLLKKIVKEEGISEEDAVEKMIQISSEPSLLRTFSFGKYAGQKIEDVCKTDRGYLEWLLGQKKQNPQGEEDWIYTLEHHLNK